MLGFFHGLMSFVAGLVLLGTVAIGFGAVLLSRGGRRKYTEGDFRDQDWSWRPWKQSADAAEDTNPAGHTVATATGTDLYGTVEPRTMDTRAITPAAGGAQSHENLMPFLCIHFIVALFGIYPSRQ